MTQEQTNEFIYLSNLVMHQLDEKGEPPTKTFEYISKFAHFVVDHGGTAYDCRITCQQLTDRVTAYIESHFAQNITIADLSRHFYVSESTISHQFRQKMGLSLYRYITQRRLIAAKTHIQNGATLEQVSRDVGFADYSTFYRAFKQEFGISPRRYRKMLDEGERGV